ncbi:MAG: V-type ATP synthase subunit I [Prolixibacteraceae bacterium]|nr:V-type ATP synthase subunit I [Prolixibacteraceae bacterium]MBT6005916.1 V-type ATP synthase subunit I [Prolixibacteraceae bacterium]MBT6764605.1 V-type ATP synthase subunit I [Prolixibacteraceae bacterium]MBT6999377.1 V-type ATP synthase subunit I [Prolixibacteraceae bacterium]
MHKYTFLIFYKEYKNFLESLQQLGVLHVVEKNKTVSDDIKQRYVQINQFEKTIQFLEKRENKKTQKTTDADGVEIMHEIIANQNKLEALEQELEETNKKYQKATAWGDFSPEILQKLKDKDIHIRFFNTSKKKYLELIDAGIPAEIISEHGNLVHFLFVQKGKDEITFEAEEVKLPGTPSSEIKKKIEQIENSIEQINDSFDEHAGSSITLLEQCKNDTNNSLNFQNVIFNTKVEADEKLMVLEGWVPDTQKAPIDDFLQKENVLFITDKATLKDRVPILLKNNRFSKLFEPVGSMFSLPDYAELDLTVFFAPFFMMFFGFCLGDAGYGLLFVVGAGLYKLKASKEIKPLLSLIQFLGLATIIFGSISGTLFGVNLIDANIPLIADYKSLFLNPDKMFNLALLLGGLQIIYGLFIKTANQIKQYGFSYSLATIGWLVVILGGAIYAILTMTEVIPQSKTILYIILSTGGFFILFFSDPEINVFARVGKGVWDIYSTVTGIFGDLLSYIRLFALGLSSAILGFVINDIAMQILGASKILGPVFFVIFLLLGHTLNILISSLGSFVHPMRLTFVEFYKNAGFKGGGEGYKPFSKQI